MMVIVMSSLLMACIALKPVEELTDKELTDKYYKVDLDLYMIKRDSGYSVKSGSSEKPDSAKTEYSNRALKKIIKIENELEIMKQELIRRGYMP